MHGICMIRSTHWTIETFRAAVNLSSLQSLAKVALGLFVDLLGCITWHNGLNSSLALEPDRMEAKIAKKTPQAS